MSPAVTSVPRTSNQLADRFGIRASDARMANLSASWFEVRGTHVTAGDIVDLCDAEPSGMAL